MSITSGDIANKLGVSLVGDKSVEITHVAPLYRAGAQSLTFINHSRFIPQLQSTGASLVILKPEWALHNSNASIIVDNPYAYYARAATILYPRERPSTGIHPSAVIAPSATISGQVSVGVNSSIADGVSIGKGVVIGAGCRISENVRIGDNTVLRGNVVVEHECQIGQQCLLQSGVVIGSDGFGYAQDNGQWVPIPQVGRVLIGDRVEIGANTTIDRGALDDTVIEEGVILDNQIQVAHNVCIGKNTAIAGCVGIAGSAKIGQRCTIGGASTVLGHLEIVDDVHINAMSLVASSIKQPGCYSSSTPHDEANQWRKNFARFRHLDKMAKRLKAVEKKSQQLEQKFNL